MRPTPIGRRSSITTASVPGNILRIEASATHGDVSSFCFQLSRSVITMLAPDSPSSRSSTSPRDMRSLPWTVMRVTVSASEARAKLIV